MQTSTPEYRAAALIHAARSNVDDALQQFNLFPVEWRPQLRQSQNALLQMAQTLADIIPALETIADAWQSPPWREDDAANDVAPTTSFHDDA